MDGINPIDPGRNIDWGKTSKDYVIFRPGPPPSFYRKLLALDIGLSKQRILDLGTGTGVLARQFASQGAKVCGIDISAEQIAMAKELAYQQNLDIDFQISSAESIPFAEHSFDIITANQCWLYFDKSKAIPEVRRLLVKGGWLMTSHFNWLPRLDPVAKQSEELILKYNPQWTAADWPGLVQCCPEWSHADFKVRAMFYYDEAIPFTRESWRGRIRACRGMGAALSAEEVAAFDQEHAALLEKIVPENFTILHRLDARIFEFK